MRKTATHELSNWLTQQQLQQNAPILTDADLERFLVPQVAIALFRRMWPDGCPVTSENMEQLSRDGIDVGLVAYQTTDAAMFAVLARHSDENVRDNVARKTADLDLLTHLATDAHERVRQTASRRLGSAPSPSTKPAPSLSSTSLVLTDAYLARLWVTDKQKALFRQAWPDGCPVTPENMEHLTRSGFDVGQLASRTMDETATEAILAVLAGHSDGNVRRRVAQTTRDEKTLRILAGDKAQDVRAAVARRTHDTRVLDALRRDAASSVREIAMKRDYEFRYEAEKLEPVRPPKTAPERYQARPQPKPLDDDCDCDDCGGFWGPCSGPRGTWHR